MYSIPAIDEVHILSQFPSTGNIFRWVNKKSCLTESSSSIQLTFGGSFKRCIRLGLLLGCPPPDAFAGLIVIGIKIRFYQNQCINVITDATLLWFTLAYIGRDGPMIHWSLWPAVHRRKAFHVWDIRPGAIWQWLTQTQCLTLVLEENLKMTTEGN